MQRLADATEYWSRQDRELGIYGLRDSVRLRPGTLYLVHGPAPWRRAVLARCAAWVCGYGRYVVYASTTEMAHRAGARIIEAYSGRGRDLVSTLISERERLDATCSGLHLDVAGLAGDLHADLRELAASEPALDAVVLDQPDADLCAAVGRTPPGDFAHALVRLAVQRATTVVAGDDSLNRDELLQWSRYAEDILRIEAVEDDRAVIRSERTGVRVPILLSGDRLIEVISATDAEQALPSNENPCARSRFLIERRHADAREDTHGR